MAKSKGAGLAIGQMVHYVLPHGAPGEHRPAVVVLALESGGVNLQVFTDAGDGLPCPFHAANVEQNEKGARGTWHSPERD